MLPCRDPTQAMYKLCMIVVLENFRQIILLSLVFVQFLSIIHCELIFQFPLTLMEVLAPCLCMLEGVARPPIDLSAHVFKFTFKHLLQSFRTIGQFLKIPNQLKHSAGVRVSSQHNL